MKYKSILYWKWDESIFEEGKLEHGLSNIVRRSGFDLIYVSFHHLGRPYDDPALYAKLKSFADGLKAAGRGLMADIDVRGELSGFLARYPGEEAQMARFAEGVLDTGGYGEITVKNPVRGRTGRGITDKGPDAVLCAWAFDKADKSESLGAPSPVNAAFSDIGNGFTRFIVNGGRENAGKRFLIAAAYSRGIPDHFSDNLYIHYRKMLEYHRDLGLAGAANDEWGYDVFTEAADGNLYFAESFPFSAGMAAAYLKQTGRSLNGDLFYFAYAPQDDIGRAYAAINDYVKLLRSRMKHNNDWFYGACKEVFGLDVFVGVHPTYWGDPYDFGFDILQNGLDWWEVKRDTAQTDEFVLIPIRLAMLHKWGGGVWYNMWYSGNTQQLHTYFTESWQNARFGGRTHYLGYECPNEPGVFNLKHPQAMEQIAEMERKLAGLDRYQQAAPDSRVLVVFGAEAVSNWLLSYGEARITRGTGTLPRVLAWTAALFEHFLCDLVPSSELENGGVRMEGGKPACGSQRYDAVIYLEPECAGIETLNFLENYARGGGRLMIMGRCVYMRDGLPAGERFRALTRAACLYSESYIAVGEAVKRLDRYKIPRNRWKNGCRHRDGTVIFTANGILPSGNYFETDEKIDGKRIRFACDDYYVYRPVKESV